MKSLKERIAEREERKEEAEAKAKEDGTSTPGDGDVGNDEGYDSWTVAELKSELDSREIEYASSDKKADLIKLLNDNDNDGQG